MESGPAVGIDDGSIPGDSDVWSGLWVTLVALQSSCLYDQCFPLPVSPSQALTHVAWGLLLVFEGQLQGRSETAFDWAVEWVREGEEGFYETHRVRCV